MKNLLDGLFRMKVGEDFYPGDFSPSENFPFTKPGRWGQINAASPLTKKGILQKLKDVNPMPKILWVRGGKDKIVSDQSFFDTAVLGKMGMIPDYPGEDICPPQPMVAQTRYTLEEIQADFIEFIMEDCGHSPYIEQPEEFLKGLMDFLNE